MGAIIGMAGRFLMTALSGLGFFSLFGVTDKDNDNSAITIALGAVSVLLAYLLLKKK
jgi:hypothetical protein